MVGEPRHRRSFLYDLAAPAGTADAAVPQQHRPHDRARVPVGRQSRRRHGADRCRTRRQHRVARARRLSRRPQAKVGRGGPAAAAEAGLAAETALKAHGRASVRADRRRGASSASARCRSPASTATRRRCSTSTPSTSRGPATGKASEYLFKTYQSFGYAPEYQWFEPPNALGGNTANVVATLKGTVNPELVYVVSSHYDSVAGGPGADDDTSGHGGAARGGARAGRSSDAGDDRLRVVHRRGSRACSAAASSCGARSRTS